MAVKSFIKKKIALGLTLLSLKSDQHETSPYNINALEYRVFLRIEVTIRKMILIDISTNSPHYFY